MRDGISCQQPGQIRTSVTILFHSLEPVPANDFHSLVKVIFHRVVERALVTCGFDIKYGKSTWIHTLFHAVEMPVDWFGKLSQRFGMYPQSSQCQSTVNIVMDNCGNLYLSKKAS